MEKWWTHIGLTDTLQRNVEMVGTQLTNTRYIIVEERNGGHLID